MLTGCGWCQGNRMTSPRPATKKVEEEDGTDMSPITAKFEKVPLDEPTTPSPTRSKFSRPDTAQTEKGLVKKTSAGGYQATRTELEEDPLERLQKRDHVCVESVSGLWVSLTRF